MAIATAIALGVALYGVVDAAAQPALGQESTPSQVEKAVPWFGDRLEDGVDQQWAEQTLATLSLEEKVGQLLLPRVFGRFYAEGNADLQEVLELAREGKVGGAVLFAGEPYGTRRVVERLRDASKVAPLIASDYEWGTAMRVDGATRFPRAMAYGAIANSSDAESAIRTQGTITAREARAMGVSILLAPVLDRVTDLANRAIATRSFGADPERVALLGAAFIEAAQAEGVLTVAKHFPGHGPTTVDSHVALPRVDLSHAQLESELEPFRRAIDAGVAGLMPAHLAIPALDGAAERPISRSPEVLGGLLRGELGFSGLVVSDALEMVGASGEGRVPVGELEIEALLAGIDVLLLPAEPRAAHAALVKAAKSGRLPMERLDDAVRRVLLAKAFVRRVGSEPPVRTSTEDPAELESSVGLSSWSGVGARVAEQSITLLEDSGGFPLASRTPPAVTSIEVLPPRAAGVSAAPLERALRARAARVDVVRTTPGGLDSAVRQLLAEPGERLAAETVVLLAWFVEKPDAPRAALTELAERGNPLVVASFYDPRAALVPAQAAFEAAPERSTVRLLAWDTSPASQRALVGALFGEAAITGRTPVALGGSGDGAAWPIGTGLERQPTAGAFTVAGVSGAGFDTARAVLEQAVLDKVTPGAVAVVGHRGEVVFAAAVGRQTYDADSPAIEIESLWDLASLTKVIVTTTLAMYEVERGRLDLDAPLERYLPEWNAAADDPRRHLVKVRDLLTHSSGILWWTDLWARHGVLEPEEARAAYLDEIFALPLAYDPGTRTEYSDLGIMLLGEVLVRLSGKPLDQLARERIFAPLGMHNTMFTPGAAELARIPPTEIDQKFRGRQVHGEVHDENAAGLGGVAPHAGLFSTGPDLARFAQAMLSGGVLDGRRILNGATVTRFTTRVGGDAGVPESSRALGWDTPSAPSSSGCCFGPGSYGHTGFTGTSLWLDPGRELFVVLLTNRVHPTRDNTRIRQLRPAFHDAVGSALEGR